VDDEERLDVFISLDTPLFQHVAGHVAETDQLLRILRAADVLWNRDRRPVLCRLEGIKIYNWRQYCTYWYKLLLPMGFSQRQYCSNYKRMQGSALYLFPTLICLMK
jgi:hypothetical protein